jgi:cobaltochelatase CobN
MEEVKPERQQRNMVQRLDGRMVNAGQRRGMLVVCATGCCCGRTERGFAPVPTDLYHEEWERRKLRNKVHLNQGGCLGPCPLANVTMLLLDSRPYWFHSLNDEALILALYDYIEILLAEDHHVAPPMILAPHIFNGFNWEGNAHVASSGAPNIESAKTGNHQQASPKFPGQSSGLAQNEPTDIVILTQADTDLLALAQAQTLLPAEFAPLRMAHIGRLPDEAAVDALLSDLLPRAAVVIIKLHGARSFAHGLDQLCAWAEATAGFLLCLPAVETLDPELMARSTVGVPLAHLISAYFQAGGIANLANGLSCLSDHLLLTGWGYDSPRELPRHGIYVPEEIAGESGGERCGDSCATCASSPPLYQEQPTVGILFYRAHLFSGNIAFVDALLAELQMRGLKGRAIYTQSLKDCEADGTPSALKLLNTDQPVDAIISTLSFALGDLDQMPNADQKSFLQQIGVPIIQAITASSQRQQWQRSGRGLGPLDTAMNVAIPEFDGRIIGVPISFKEETDSTGAARYVPDPERVARLIGIVQRQIALRRKPNAEKRIAFVLTNSSAKAQRVGNAVGLDAPASLIKLLKRMAAEGYTIGDLPESSDQLLLDLIDRCSYDQTWLTEAQLQRAYPVPAEQYQSWFAELPSALRANMEQQWGEAPGKAYFHKGALCIPGAEFGNAFIALQPPRGYDMDPNAIYHRPDLPPPHNYYALYRWLRDEWRADAIVHVGKHGTLEWLPGKGVGLSAECFPDQFLGDLPLIYPFIINDPGEGNQAKRRSHAVIVDHMTPPMTSAGSYGGLAELAQLVDEYYQMEQLDPTKLPLLQRQIWDVIQTNSLDDDLRYILRADHGDHSHEWDGAFLDDGTPTVFAELAGPQVAHLLEDIEGYLCELTGAQIRDGLHILGALPTGEQLVELLYHLLKLPNLQIPSLSASVAAHYGEDWAALQERPGQRRAPDAMPQVELLPSEQATAELQSNAGAITLIETQSKALLRSLDKHTWNNEVIEQIITDTLGGASARNPTTHRDIVTALRFANDQIIPNLRVGAHDEIANLMGALSGHYVPAGPSGAPTRGMAHVLPTGRNFYACDPRALPSMAAWQVGQGLADDLIMRYRREHGSYPASVGISIWGTSAIRTAGDDIAQVLALLGVRPSWQKANRRVVGIEIIPLAELGRPRIDVVCRISGFFRDAFPHLITLLDQAFQAVMMLDESSEENFPRRHALAAEARLRLQGQEADRAQQEARYRVFGCAPGSYGAGILPLIDAGNWTNDADFAEVYLNWGGYAYTEQQHGVVARAAFADALSSVQVATKNQDNREHDIFDSDDYLQFHGGMIATIRALTGKNPARYFGDSSNPSRPRTRDLREEARRVYRSRVINPKWIESMKRHGYKGGLELAATVDYLFGYDATAQVLDDWMYQGIVNAYLRDEELQQFFADSNPWAWQAIAEKLLEAIERGIWQDPDPLDEQLLKAAKAYGLEELRQREAQALTHPDR